MLTSEPFLAVADRLAPSWGLSDLFVIRDGMNHVLGASQAGREVILRVTDDTHRPRLEVEAEVEWVAYLAGRGCQVCRPIPDAEGRLLHTQEEAGRVFHAVCFEKMAGLVVNPGDDLWGPPLFEAWGRALGRLHRESAQFQPTVRRPDWREMSELSVDGFRGRLPGAVLDRIEGYLADLRAKPHGAGYGLVHNDAKSDNFFVVDGRVELFDFDESCYCWQIQDLLVAFYFYYAYPLMRRPDEPADEAATWLSSVLQGYRQEWSLPAEQLELAVDLMRMREILIYLVIAGEYEHWHPVISARPHATCSHDEAIALMEERLLSGRPCVDLDFRQFA